MTKSLMFLGTGSDVGKSIVVTAFCRIFKRRGFKVAPFKAQNMSNNSYVTLEGGEIGRAQVVQAEAAGLVPSVHMNPVLLKPSSKNSSQVVVHGKPLNVMSAKKYHIFKGVLKNSIITSFNILANDSDVILLEGAGSCCEVNLKSNDIANFEMAKSVGAKCIIVADIDRGGVFAQIIGTMELLEEEEKDLVIGFIINKFRGDPDLFKSGISFIEEKTNRPVLGLVPFFENISIDPEDSVVIQGDKRRVLPLREDSVNIAIVRLPAISNFTDFEALELEENVVVNYLSHPEELYLMYDLLILPGTKNVVEDSIWLEKTGWKKKINEFKEADKWIIGICGGYQLLGKGIKDPYGVESNIKEVAGLGLLPMHTVLAKEKIVRKVRGISLLNEKRIEGYEIHMGRTHLSPGITQSPFVQLESSEDVWFDGYLDIDKKIAGTYVHGIFDCYEFRSSFLNLIRKQKGLLPIDSQIKDLVQFKQKEYDKLADLFEAHCDVNRIISSILG